MNFLVKHEFGNVIHQGTKAECELVLKAFVTYGISEHKFSLEEVVEKHRLSDKTREEVLEYLIERLPEGMFGDGAESDYVECGFEFKGVVNMTDSELLEQLEYICDEDHELYVRAQAELAVEAMLSDDEVKS